MDLLIIWLVTSVSLFLISKLPIGVEIESFPIAIISAAVFGILNALVKPILSFLVFPITLITLGLFTLVINGIIFALAAWLVNGFRLRLGLISAIIGSLALSFVNSIIYHVLSLMNIITLK